MFKKITLLFFTILFISSISGCRELATPTGQTEAPSSQSEATPPADDTGQQQLLPIISRKAVSLQLDASADGSTVQLKPGELMAVTLESNPSTGYAWFATSSDPEIIVQQAENEYKEAQSNSAEPVLGAAGSETLYFEAMKAGTASLTLDYKRGWETDTAPEQSLTITVEVK